MYNVEVKPGSGAKLVRSAGNYAEVVAHNDGYAQIKLPSTEVRMIPDHALLHLVKFQMVSIILESW